MRVFSQNYLREEAWLRIDFGKNRVFFFCKMTRIPGYGLVQKSYWGIWHALNFENIEYTRGIFAISVAMISGAGCKVEMVRDVNGTDIFLPTVRLKDTDINLIFFSEYLGTISDIRYLNWISDSDIIWSICGIYRIWILDSDSCIIINIYTNKNLI